jgi:ketosteroid isomerase-like protein
VGAEPLSSPSSYKQHSRQRSKIRADVAEAVRTAIERSVRLRTHRSLEERIYVRWPSTYAVVARMVLRLPPRSRLRRATLRRAAVSGWAALSRGDLDLMLVRFAPDCQYEPPPEFYGSGMLSINRGDADIREQVADLRQAWEQMETTPLEIVDAGDRFVVLGRQHVRGRGSGVELDTAVGEALWVRRGLIVRDRFFFDWDAALRAAGVSRDALADHRLTPEGDAP